MVAVNELNKLQGMTDKGCYFTLTLGRGANIVKVTSYEVKDAPGNDIF
jgi:hypothetical protein